MAIYTVHVPAGDERTPERAERVRFVKEGFAFWALVLPLVWLIWHRLWLGLLLFLLGVLGIVAIDRFVGEGVSTVVSILFLVWFAIEARNIRRWTLDRRGYTFAGVVEATDLAAAERRFFETWTAEQPSPDLPLPTHRAVVPAGAGPGPVIGLFPGYRDR
jgi:hypothetical protein